jgi:cell wall-associated NlpC family hydrolase
MSAMQAIVRTALAPVRAAPGNRAELVSQEPLGAILDVLERTGEWAHCRGEDGYEGWLSIGGLVLCGAGEAEAWWDNAGGKPAVALDATVADAAGRPLVRLPWGARVAVDGPVARLPDGRTGALAEGRWIIWEEVGARFPQEGTAAAKTAREWMGVPYVWGGRTRWGADCSGFVQAVYRLHGFLLPRDSYEQAEIGEPIDAGTGFEGLEAGDLLFFRADNSTRVVHVALSLGGPLILHAAEANGCIQEDDLAGESELARSLAKRMVGVRRLFWLS